MNVAPRESAQRFGARRAWDDAALRFLVHGQFMTFSSPGRLLTSSAPTASLSVSYLLRGHHNDIRRIYATTYHLERGIGLAPSRLPLESELRIVGSGCFARTGTILETRVRCISERDRRMEWNCASARTLLWRITEPCYSLSARSSNSSPINGAMKPCFGAGFVLDTVWVSKVPDE